MIRHSGNIVKYPTEIHVGDILKVKSGKWYADNCDSDGNVKTKYANDGFVSDMLDFCGETVTVGSINGDCIWILEDSGQFLWYPDFFEEFD